jgi:hypothetical protein
MLLLSILLFWLPLIGPFLAGFVGGKKAGGVLAAIAAVLIPVVVLGVLLFALGTALSGVPLIGMLAGAGGFVLILAELGPLILGAFIGGLIA